MQFGLNKELSVQLEIIDHLTSMLKIIAFRRLYIYKLYHSAMGNNNDNDGSQTANKLK